MLIFKSPFEIIYTLSFKSQRSLLPVLLCLQLDEGGSVPALWQFILWLWLPQIPLGFPWDELGFQDSFQEAKVLKSGLPGQRCQGDIETQIQLS